MKALFSFALAALRARNAYIDFDGTLAHSVQVAFSPALYAGARPAQINQFWLESWQAEINRIGRGRLIYRRMLFLLMLRAFGVRLHLWTNRGAEVREATLRTLGRWVWLFTSLGFYGKEHIDMPDKTESAAEHLGPLMDDMEKYVRLGKPGSLLVRKY